MAGLTWDRIWAFEFRGRRYSSLYFLYVPLVYVGRDSAVGIATRYGLDGARIVSRCGSEIFRIRPDRFCGPPSLVYSGYRVFPGVKRPGRGVDHPLPYSAEVKERVELYLCSWPVIGRTFPFCLFSYFTTSVRNERKTSELQGSVRYRYCI